MMTTRPALPSNVAWFEKLMYLSFAMGLGVMAFDGPRLAAKPEMKLAGGPAFMITTGLLTILILMLIVWLIARRRKGWARWVFAILFVMGLPFSIGFMGEMLRENPVAGIISAGQAIVQAIASVLVFVGNSRPWFAKDNPQGALDV